MVNHKRMVRSVNALLILAMLSLGFNHVAYGAMVSTQAIISAEKSQHQRTQLRDLLSREAVQEQLMAMEVDPAEAILRVESMTDEEIQTLAGQLETLPAGGGVTGLLVLALVVLVITDILGYTDIFTFIKK